MSSSLRTTETIDVLGNGLMIRNGAMTSVNDYVAEMNNDVVCVFISETKCFAFQSTVPADNVTSLQINCARYDSVIKTTTVKTSELEKYFCTTPGELHVLI
jgi:hypothetical protein